MSQGSNRVVVFLHGGEYDRMHQGFSIAVTAASSGRTVEVYLFWWALERLLADRLDEPDFPGHEGLAEDFADKGFPTLRQLIEAARDTGQVRLLACSGSLAILGKTTQALEGKVDELVGWAAILERTAGVSDRFFL